MIAQALDLLNAGDFAGAARVCRRLLETDKRNHQAMVLLGQVESNGGRHDEAVALLSRAVALASRNVDYHVKYGEVLVAAGRNEAALLRFDKALRIKPDSPIALSGKADVYLRTRETDKARRLLASFVELVRYLGVSAEQCRRGFEKIWQFMRPRLLSRPAVRPRIWNT